MAVSNQLLENLGIEMIVEGVVWEDLPARMYAHGDAWPLVQNLAQRKWNGVLNKLTF